MVNSAHTGVLHVEQNQSQKEVTINEAFDRLSKFVAATKVYSGVSADVTPTVAAPDYEWFNAFRFILEGAPGGPINFNCPSGATYAREFLLANNLGQTVTVQVTGADSSSITVDITTGNFKRLYYDGTSVYDIT